MLQSVMLRSVMLFLCTQKLGSVQLPGPVLDSGWEVWQEHLQPEKLNRMDGAAGRTTVLAYRGFIKTLEIDCK